ncbi:MAG: hypothetical protein JWO11_454 [Nocardioides sp.]|nr:hypothetical protein [Nocardioides sp.]
MSRVRILHVNKFLYRRGGAEGYLLDLAALQRTAGHEVAYFGMEHPDNDQPSAGRPPAYVEFEPAPAGVPAKVARLGRMVWSTSARRGMDEAIEEFRPDVVHAHNIYHQLSPSVLHAARQRGIPIVLTMHDYKLVCPTYQFLDNGQICTACVGRTPWPAVRRACKDGSRAASTAAAVEVSLHRWFGAYDGVQVFVAPSRFLAQQVTAGGIPGDRVRVLPNFTELDVVFGAPVRRGAVVAGRLSPEKGIDTLIRAIAGLDLPPGVLLDVAGDGPERPALEALAAAEAPGRVRFHGRLGRPELQELVGEAAVCVVPSRWHENQPLAVLEAFALGVPVVATNLGGLPELVDDTTGWVVPPDDVPALRGALREALGSAVESRRRGLAARRVAELEHNPKDHLEAITELYREAGARE